MQISPAGITTISSILHMSTHLTKQSVGDLPQILKRHWSKTWLLLQKTKETLKDIKYSDKHFFCNLKDPTFLHDCDINALSSSLTTHFPKGPCLFYRQISQLTLVFVDISTWSRHVHSKRFHYHAISSSIVREHHYLDADNVVVLFPGQTTSWPWPSLMMGATGR